MYSPENLDNALMLAGNEWVRVVKPVKTLTTLTLTPGSNAMPTVDANWKPQYQLQQTLMLSGKILNPNFVITDYNAVLYQQFLQGGDSTTNSGRPSMAGYPDNGSGNTGICFPTPDKAYTLTFWWWVGFPSWTAGGSGPSFASFPDEQLRIIATDGVESYLQANEKGNQDIAAAARVRFREKMQEFLALGTGGRGAQVSYRDDPDACYPRNVVTVG